MFSWLGDVLYILLFGTVVCIETYSECFVWATFFLKSTKCLSFGIFVSWNGDGVGGVVAYLVLLIFTVCFFSILSKDVNKALNG